LHNNDDDDDDDDEDGTVFTMLYEGSLCLQNFTQFISRLLSGAKRRPALRPSQSTWPRPRISCL